MVEDFREKLERSGYSREQQRHVISAGLTTYERRCKAARADKTSIYRSLQTMSLGRDIKKQIGKTTWFMNKPRGLPALGGSRKSVRKSSRKYLTPAQQAEQPVSVMFIPRTGSGMLLKVLRTEEQGLQQGGLKGYRKIKLPVTF